MNKILDSLSSNFLTVTLKGVGGWSPNKPLKSASAVLAQANGGTNERAYRGSVNILPAPYNLEYNALIKAFNAVRSEFYTLTMPFGHTTDPKTGNSHADGVRLLVAMLLANGKFTNSLAALDVELDQARAAFANVIATRVHEIQTDHAVHIDGMFDPAWYPTPSEILAGWRYEPIVPMPLADGSKLRGMAIPIQMVSAIEAQMEAQATSQIRFGQSQIAQETLDNIKTMASNLTKLDQWFSSQDGRRPAIYDSLVTNLQDSLIKLRTYAIPNTEEGERLLALADDIESRLDIGSMKAEDFKTDQAMTRTTAKEADRLSRDIESALDDLFATGSPPARATMQVPPVKPAASVEPTEPPAETPFVTMDEVDDAIEGYIANHVDQEQTLRQIQAEVSDLDALLEEWA